MILPPEPEDKKFADALWIVQNPQFQEKPATIIEFLGPKYLNIEKGVRPGIKAALVELFGEEVQTTRIAIYQKAMLTGAIGIGKSTFAAIAIPYMVHWVLCLRDPQDFFDLLPGSRIAFMMMSTSEKQARGVIFGDILARIKNSPWFSIKYPHDSTFKLQIKFPKDINILPGDSKENTFEGYNILGGILDEMDSHTVTKDVDYADVGYNTIEGRITSRFGNRGLLIPIGQMKKSTGFAARKYASFLVDSDAFVVRMTIWDSLGWDWKGDTTTRFQPFMNEDGTRDSFFYDYKRRQYVPNEAMQFLPESKTILEIPNYYRKNFRNAPEKALKDLAGIPPTVSDPFISMLDKIDSAQNSWIRKNFGEEPEGGYNEDISVYSPVSDSCHRPEFAKWFTNVGSGDPRRRAAHIDIAYSANGDALGLAMGHVEGLKKTDDDEEKPVICIDFALRVRAPEGTEIMLSDIRKIIYLLRDTLKFRLKKVTYDGFESTDSVQQLRKKRFEAEKVSMDKSTLPYEDVREAIYEDRLMLPPYITEWKRGGDLVNIIYKELSELQDMGKKIDHPPEGSKDVTDAIAGVVHELMGDRRYRRGVLSLDVTRQLRHENDATGTDVMSPNYDPRTANYWTGNMPQAPALTPGPEGMLIPQHLRPRR